MTQTIMRLNTGKCKGTFKSMSDLPGSSVMAFRVNVQPSDAERVRVIVGSSGFFSPAEVEVAVELVNEALAKGPDDSGYHFLLAERAGTVAGYTCFGPIACTEGSYDLYWIAVQNEFRGTGLGTELLRRSEALIAARGGRRIYVETSSRAQYLPTRRFYEACGYRPEAVLEQFYAPQDDKIIYLKVLR